MSSTKEGFRRWRMCSSWVFREADTRRFKRHVEEILCGNREEAWRPGECLRRGCKFDPERNGQKSWAEASYGAMRPEDRLAKPWEVLKPVTKKTPVCWQYVCLIPTTVPIAEWAALADGLRTEYGRGCQTLQHTGPL